MKQERYIKLGKLGYSNYFMGDMDSLIEKLQRFRSLYSDYGSIDIIENQGHINFGPEYVAFGYRLETDEEEADRLAQINAAQIKRATDEDRVRATEIEQLKQLMAKYGDAIE